MDYPMQADYIEAQKWMGGRPSNQAAGPPRRMCAFALEYKPKEAAQPQLFCQNVWGGRSPTRRAAPPATWAVTIGRGALVRGPYEKRVRGDLRLRWRGTRCFHFHINDNHKQWGRRHDRGFDSTRSTLSRCSTGSSAFPITAGSRSTSNPYREDGKLALRAVHQVDARARGRGREAGRGEDARHPSAQRRGGPPPQRCAS